MRAAKAGNYLIAVAGIAELNHCFQSRYDYLGTVPVVGQISHVTFVLGGNLNVKTRPSAAGSCLRGGGLGVPIEAVLGPGRELLSWSGFLVIDKASFSAGSSIE